MKLFGLCLLAAVSLSAAVTATASTRPHYGGTLRISVREAPASLDPADPNPAGLLALPGISRLIFENLVTLDARGQTQPALATSWQVEPGNQRWQFNLRRGVRFDDGTAASSDVAAASLRAANPNWKVFATGEAVVVECDTPTFNLPAMLALPRYAIAKRGGGKLAGTGPFAVNRWDPGKKLTLIARDDYWGGRAFLDSIEIEMGRSFREQMIALDLGKADVVEVAPEQVRRATLEGRRIQSSASAEWMGLVFGHDSPSGDDAKLRESLALGINRESMNNVLLQGAGEPAGSLLANWLTGYAFLFPTTADLQRARQVRGEIHTAPAWTVGYDASDALARVIAERIALNASDAGLTLQALPLSMAQLQGGSSALADLRLVRFPLPSLDPQVALGELAVRLGLPSPRFDGDPAYSLYAAESALLQSRRVIPLLYVRTTAALNVNVMGWHEDPDGGWHLTDVWLETGKR